MTTLRYKLIIYWSKADEPFVVEVPELPGRVADGATYEVAVPNARGGVQEWIDTPNALGRSFPKSTGKLVYTRCIFF